MVEIVLGCVCWGDKLHVLVRWFVRVSTVWGQRERQHPGQLQCRQHVNTRSCCTVVLNICRSNRRNRRLQLAQRLTALAAAGQRARRDGEALRVTGRVEARGEVVDLGRAARAGRGRLDAGRRHALGDVSQRAKRAWQGCMECNAQQRAYSRGHTELLARINAQGREQAWYPILVGDVNSQLALGEVAGQPVRVGPPPSMPPRTSSVRCMKFMNPSWWLLWCGQRGALTGSSR